MQPQAGRARGEAPPGVRREVAAGGHGGRRVRIGAGDGRRGRRAAADGWMRQGVAAGRRARRRYAAGRLRSRRRCRGRAPARRPFARGAPGARSWPETSGAGASPRCAFRGTTAARARARAAIRRRFRCASPARSEPSRLGETRTAGPSGGPPRGAVLPLGGAGRACSGRPSAGVRGGRVAPGRPADRRTPPELKAGCETGGSYYTALAWSYLRRLYCPNWQNTTRQGKMVNYFHCWTLPTLLTPVTPSADKISRSRAGLAPRPSWASDGSLPSALVECLCAAPPRISFGPT